MMPLLRRMLSMTGSRMWMKASHYVKAQQAALRNPKIRTLLRDARNQHLETTT